MSVRPNARLTGVAAALALALAGFAPARAAPASDAPLSGAQFEAYSQGKTLYYATGGKPYGAEQYLPGRRVVWAFLGQPCQRGWWYAKRGTICFSYEGRDAGPQCWQFFHEPEGLRAHYLGADEGTAGDLVEVRQSPVPLACPGPGAGV